MCAMISSRVRVPSQSSRISAALAFRAFPSARDGPARAELCFGRTTLLLLPSFAFVRHAGMPRDAHEGAASSVPIRELAKVAGGALADVPLVCGRQKA
jgi:hypothetical protein